MSKCSKSDLTKPNLCDLLPPLLPDEYERLKASIAERGYVGEPTIADQDNTTVDGFHRQRACDELGIFCPKEVRLFETQVEKYELALRLNCRRRQLSRAQKQALIEVYLRCDSGINDKHLADIIGVSQNTVASVREKLVATFQIEKFHKLRGRDGKVRPTKYKRIVANTAKEIEAALEAISDLPDACEGKTLDVVTAQRRARRNKQRVERENAPVPTLTSDDIKLHHCRFQDLEGVAGIEPASVNLVFPDIPYGRDFLPQISDLAALASRILVDGGLFVMYSGQYWLPEVLRRLDEHLTWCWMRASVWDGDGNLIHPVDVTSQWKPMVVYSKGPWRKRGRWPDLSRVTRKEKDRHKWQQPLAEVEEVVRYFSQPGELVVDPCGGGFTTAVACYRLGRRCISCDCEESCVDEGRRRLVEEMAEPSPRIAADDDAMIPEAHSQQAAKAETVGPRNRTEGNARQSSPALSIEERANLLRDGKHSPAHGIVLTPPEVAQFLYGLLSPLHPKTVLDVASGNGDLSRPWRDSAEVIEYELAFGNDFFQCAAHIDTDLVLCNPPFGKEKEFLRRIIEVVPLTAPIVLFATHRVRLGSYASGQDWRWCRDEWPPITSIVSLPRGVFKGVNETIEVLIFRAPRLSPHYFLGAKDDCRQEEKGDDHGAGAASDAEQRKEPVWGRSFSPFALDEVEKWQGRKLTESEEAMRRFFEDKSWLVGGPIPLCLLYGTDSTSLLDSSASDDVLQRAEQVLGNEAAELKEQMHRREIDPRYHGGLALLYLRLCRGMAVSAEQSGLAL